MNDILSKNNGAKFYTCDLHIHTPASKCYKEKNVTAEDIVETAINKKIEIIAITDHNSEGWFEKVSEAAKGKNLLVLPGVEITTPHGGERQVHILAIFDPLDYKKVDELLIKIDISHDKRGKSDTVANKTIPEIMKIVDELGGISILSHVDSNCGLDTEIQRLIPAKKEILESPYLRGIEITKMETKEKYNNMGHACIQNSDAHSLDAIGRRYSLIKMDKPSFEGLRLALGDYDSRIRLNDELPNHPHIIGIKFEGGFLNSQTIKFNIGLNCIIGGKGTGKSTIIELIRYAMGMSSDILDIRKKEENKIRGVLGDNGKITMLVNANNGENYVIERVYGKNPKILRECGEETSIDIDQFRREFFKIEFYGQGELLEIANSGISQLNMIDQYIDFENLKECNDELLKKLAMNKNKILTEDGAIYELKSKIKDLPIIEEKLRTLNSKGIGDELKDHMYWEDEKRILNEIKKQMDDSIKYNEEILMEFRSNRLIAPAIEDMGDLPNRDKISECISLLKNSKEEVECQIMEQIKLLNKCNKKINKIYADWTDEYNYEKERMRELLLVMESDGISVKDYNDYLELEKKRKELEELNKIIITKENNLNKLNNERKKLLEELEQNRKEVYNKRKEFINRINESLKNIVKIKIEKEGDNSKYKEFLVNEVLSSSSYRILKEDRAKIADKVHPRDFSKILEQEDHESLANRACISEDAAKKAIILAKNKLYEIQTAQRDDKITIMLKDGGWKEVESVSDGQKCTAILSIAMNERNIPLIIDQPEDSLDNSFIYDAVVKMIRKIKNKRQLIIVTHNANIPVLGDSELMLVMTSNGRNGFVTKRGAIDGSEIKSFVQKILEGGKEAFEKRKEKYGI